MKLTMIVLALSLVASVNQANATSGKSNCDAAQLKSELQKAFDQKREYAPKRIVNFAYMLTIPSRQSAMIIAGNDDITYNNQGPMSVDVFTMVTTDLVSRKFFAIVVDSKACKVVDSKLVDDITE